MSDFPPPQRMFTPGPTGYVEIIPPTEPPGEPAWMQEVRDDKAGAYRWVDTNMPAECVAARARFIATNMHLQGIDWWTALDMLIDADAHLDVIEPLAERIAHWSALHAYVTLTLIYSVKAFTTEWDNDERYIAVRATIENNGLPNIIG